MAAAVGDVAAAAADAVEEADGVALVALVLAVAVE